MLEVEEELAKVFRDLVEMVVVEQVELTILVLQQWFLELMQLTLLVVEGEEQEIVLALVPVVQVS
jgi:hypothetical protein